jgi:SAM-dependent methyltransferase
MQILIGCGHSRKKQLAVKGREEWEGLVTLDSNAEVAPDVLWNLNILPLPFEDNSASEIHAYQVLEHTGQQGNWRFFFRQWNDFYRILEPGGLFLAIVPRADGPWAWADPGHTRIMSRDSLIFIHRPSLIMGTTTMSDYRSACACDFDYIHVKEEGDDLAFVLQAVKPARQFGGG